MNQNNADIEINLGAEFERQLNSVMVNVFRIPPLNQAEGYRCTGWEGNQLWHGRLRVLVKGKNARIVLDEPDTGKFFAECPLDHPNAVEPVTDSSRYFVLRVVQGTRHAFIGIGMQERNESFDFKIAVENARKIAADFEAEQNAPQAPVEIQSSGRDYSLHKGQKITINLPNGQTTRKKRTVNGGFRL
ncbi:adaptin ear-binding coat-associated protein 1 NECAP-1 [Histomonas meleagridis]|uniref:adaptin ear-binding coat-associated protein 1 NECAP-1 n=1 Tax=Histomonas meleagridis TaxID=135588 RepID=UPI00355ABF89|nr:adaptin ear-binding coat-associated protein 1 NECAP-1 [Histomonas meleagridis]KAH0806719.1 adaptin ear-binding coat-associated protein 1 NECAP-1 [Histomonas meleagridis]